MARRFGKSARQYQREVAREEADERRSQAYNRRLKLYHEEMRGVAEDERQILAERQQLDFISTFSNSSSNSTVAQDDASAKTIIAIGLIATLLAVLWAIFVN